MPSPLRVLYIDDLHFGRDFVHDVLHKGPQDFQITEVASRQEFVQRLNNDTYDVVLSDLNIVGFKGLEILEAVRAQAPDLPLVIVTSPDSEALAVAALHCGADDYVLKGVHPIQRLPFVLRTLCEKKRLQEELQQANKIKTDFLATISHELRTPLNVILGYTNLMLEGMFGKFDEEQQTPLQRIEENAKNLLTLISDALGVIRLETGQLSIDPKEVDLQILLAELRKTAPDFSSDKSPVHLLWAIAPDLPHLFTDPGKLTLIIKHLLNNALKFTERGSILVSAAAVEGGVEISIADTGVGIATEVLPIIFEPFRQGDGSSTRRYEGAGIGLYIAQRLLDRLGGSIAVESTVGQGSTFRIHLPLILPQ